MPLLSWPARQENTCSQWNRSLAEVFSLSSDRNISSNFVIWTLALFFGWLLSFPFYGPVLQVIDSERFFFLSLIVTGFHASAFFAGGVFFKIAGAWKKIMLLSLSAIICVNILLLFARSCFWPVGMALLGVASALFILGWSVPFVASTTGGDRVKQMALTIILSNMVYQLYKTLTTILSPKFLLFTLLCPLLIAFWFLLHGSGEAPPLPARQPGREFNRSYAVILVPALFIFGLYLNSGFMYKVMIPTLAPFDAFSELFRYIPYILVLALVWLLGKKLQLNFLIYLGVSLLGLAFVSFALLNHGPSRFFMTETIVQGAFALLDLCCWVLLAEIAVVYGNSCRAFGFGLGAMLAGIFAGDLIGGRLLLLDDSFRLVTALFAAAAIFLAILIIPWLNERVFSELKPLQPGWDEADPLDSLLFKMPPGRELTTREAEIIRLLLEGISNREIARRLYISENTLKTHLKHVYRKTGVTRKRELLSMALRKENHP